MEGIAVDLDRMGYSACSDLQDAVLTHVAAGNLPDTLLLVEHDPVITLGAGFQREHLLADEATCERLGIEICPTTRGGDVTYHGPGQLVIYPIFDVARHGKDLRLWLRNLEEAVIRAMATHGLAAFRFPPHTGVWVECADRERRKAAAIGIKVKRWVSMHGIAVNCTNVLEPFDLIVPCGIRGFGVTSLSRELGRDLGPELVRPAFIRAFEDVFGLKMETRSRRWLESAVKG